ncbi:MAG: hypothetical protein NC548_13140 [Lachnospiraceae bacterium]|nr:hypothetical protein [Lachnospiraceae bacterium]MCM1230665.1 hypothetical protein [Ruminococcus flavefaciens]
MADEIKKNDHPILKNIAELATPDNIQKYVLGTKKNGNPRAIYDVVKDYTIPKKKKKKKSKAQPMTTYDFYVSAKKSKKKKKKKKNKDFWHI